MVKWNNKIPTNAANMYEINCLVLVGDKNQHHLPSLRLLPINKCFEPLFSIYRDTCSQLKGITGMILHYHCENDTSNVYDWSSYAYRHSKWSVIIRIVYFH